MVKETVQYYIQNSINVYGAVLDASKTFDRIEYRKLFYMLIARKLPPLVIRLLIDLYTKQSMNVRWNNANSANFDISNGVKQGGVLSPILFCIHMDNLLTALKDNGTGCHVGTHYCRSFACADDIILLSECEWIVEYA